MKKRNQAQHAFVTPHNGHATAWLNLMHEPHVVSTAFRRMAELRAICERELAELCKNYPEISLAVVATADARLISMRSSMVKDGDRKSVV